MRESIALLLTARSLLAQAVEQGYGWAVKSQEQRKFPCPESSHEECSLMLSIPGTSGVHDRTPSSCMQAPIPAFTLPHQGFTILQVDTQVT